MDKTQVYELNRAPTRLSTADSNGYWDLLPAKVLPAVRYALEYEALNTLVEQFSQLSSDTRVIPTDFQGYPSEDWIAHMASNFNCFTFTAPDWTGLLPTVSKYAKKSFRIRNDVGVPRKIVPISVGTIFLIFGMFIL